MRSRKCWPRWGCGWGWTSPAGRLRISRKWRRSSSRNCWGKPSLLIQRQGRAVPLGRPFSYGRGGTVFGRQGPEVRILSAQANIATSMAEAPSEPESSVSPLSTRSRRLAASVLLTFHSSFVFLKQLLSFVGEFLGLLDALPQRLLRLLDLFD